MKANSSLMIVVLVFLVLGSCSEPTGDLPLVEGDDPAARLDAISPGENPLLQPSPLQFGYPRFDIIEAGHFLPAFEDGMASQLIEIEAIASQAAAPDFENTLVALEFSGQILNRVSEVFNNLVAVSASDELRGIQQQLVPLLTAHDQKIVNNQQLFTRISSLYEQRASLGLEPESQALLKHYYHDFVRAGAQLSPSGRQQLRDVNYELNFLQTIYSENVIRAGEQLAGSLSGVVGVDVTLRPTTDQPLLALIQDRSVREEVHLALLERGADGGEFDNRETLIRILQLRATKARLLGYENFADYVLAQQSIMSLDKVDKLLGDLLTTATGQVELDAIVLQKYIEDNDENIQLEAWDWRFYSEKLRLSELQDGASDLEFMPYFELENVLQKGVFFAANRLYGLSFDERFDLPVYHEDVRVFEVFDAVGSSLALFITDYYGRPGKMTGAWANSYVSQSGLLRSQAVVGNHLSLRRPTDGAPVLLTLGEVRTLFHEFGHALHAMFSNVEYPYFSGTRVADDFVEYAGLANEIWATSPVVLDNYAVHYQSGEKLPPELLQASLLEAQYDQGFTTVEYVEAAMLDLALHRLAADVIPAPEQLQAFEKRTLQQAGADLALVPPRYRSSYFLHIVGGFEAGYYAYGWNDVLGADTAQWFRDNGGLTRENGDHFRRTVLSRGGSVNGMQLFQDFAGREVDIQPLAQQRGLNVN